MSAPTRDGGPAFPTEWHNDTDVNVSAPDGQVVPPHGAAMLYGMSLRDYFAAHAPYTLTNAATFMRDDETQEECLCRLRWSHADLMLKTRARRPA